MALPTTPWRFGATAVTRLAWAGPVVPGNTVSIPAAAAEKDADDRGEERGDRAVRVAEHERVAEEQGEPAAGEEEAEKGDGLECHRDPDGALAPDAVRDRSHDEAAGDGADAESRDDPGAGQRGVPEVARERHEVDERDEDRDPRRRERGAQHPERACPDRARQGPDALVGAGGGDRTARPVGVQTEALGVAPHHLGHQVHEEEDPDAEGGVRRPPADRGHEELGHRWQREGANARAARGEADGEAAPRDEPFDDRRVARHVRGGHAEPRHEAVEHVRLPELGDERHAGERDAEEEPAGGDHDAWAPEVGEPPGGKAEDAVGEGVDGKGPGEARAAPAELPQERGEEDAERVLGAVGDEEDKERAGDDDPAVEDTHDQTRPFLPLSFGSTSARNLPVYEPAVWATTSGVRSATISPPSSPPSGPRSTA